MNKFVKRPFLIIPLAILLLTLLWLVYCSVGKAIIESAYNGESFPFLNTIIKGQAKHSLEFYYGKAERYMAWISVLILSTFAFSIPMIYFLLTKEKFSRIISSKKLYLAASLILLIWFSCSALFFQPSAYVFGSDYWEHSATIKEWSSNLWNPKNPHLAVEHPSPRFNPYFFILSAAARVLHLTPFQTMGLGAIINISLLLIGIFLFFRLYFNDSWAPLLGLIILLTAWGTGYPGSNLYQLRSLFFVIAYPSAFTFALALISLWIVKEMLRKKRSSSWVYVSLGILSPLMFLSHPHVYAFAIGSVFILVLTELKASLKTRMLPLISIVAGFSLVEVWPYFSVNKLIVNSLHIQAIRPAFSRYIYEPDKALLLLGPSLVGIPIVIYMIFKKKEYFISLGFIVMAIPYFGNKFFPIPTEERFFIYAVFYLHLALVWAFFQAQSQQESIFKQSSSLRIQKNVLCWLISLFFGWNVTVAILEFGGYPVDFSLNPPKRFSELSPIPHDMKRISHFIPEDGVVLATPYLSWPIPTFSGKVVGMLHVNPLVPDDAQRFCDSLDFFNPKTSHEERLIILKHYDVTHVLYEEKNTPEPVIATLYTIGKETIKVNDYRLIQLTSLEDK